MCPSTYCGAGFDHVFRFVQRMNRGFSKNKHTIGFVPTLHKTYQRASAVQCRGKSFSKVLYLISPRYQVQGTKYSVLSYEPALN